METGIERTRVETDRSSEEFEAGRRVARFEPGVDPYYRLATAIGISANRFQVGASILRLWVK
jgi:hypothetical protein